MITAFPDPESADENGLLCIGGDLEVVTLVEAYSNGIFPWPHPGYPLLWFSPSERGIIEFADLHIPRSLQKFLKKTELKITFDRAFDDVIRECSRVPRPGQDTTWITQEMVSAYIEFHRKGYAHSVEAWNGEKLVGGIYGVWVGGVFVGESMFYKEENASKVCLLRLIEFLKSQGMAWMDVQMITPVVKMLGGKYISRREFLARWRESLVEHPFSYLKAPFGGGD